MLGILRILFDWSEVWALFIPLTVLWVKKPAYDWAKPVTLYLIIALVLNLGVDIIWYGNKYRLFRVNNNVLYNVHAVVRLVCFTLFFGHLGLTFVRLNKFVPGVIFLCCLILFFTNGFLTINSFVLALTSAVLFVYCLIFFYLEMQMPTGQLLSKNPAFWVVAGLCLFTAINFFIYLSFNYLVLHSKEFSVDIWDVHNVFYIIMSVFIAIAFAK